MLALVENVRRKQLAWVEAVLAHKSWRPSRLAKEAGIDHSTLGKFIKDKANIAQLNTATVEKIAAVGGIPPYQTQPISILKGLSEHEAEPFNGADARELWDMVEALKAKRGNGVDAWVLQSRALEAAGYLPGDVLVVDHNATPISGDAVFAEVLDRSGHSETIMRLFEDPFLVGASLDRKLMRPLLVDSERVAVRGVVIAALRPRRAA